MNEDRTDILLVGIGNSGRRDDGLGWAFVDSIAPSLPDNWAYEYRYQLQIEDAELIAGFEKVYFVDADRRHHPAGFVLEALHPAAGESFTSHELSAQAVLHLCKEIYGPCPDACMLGISGGDFGLECGLSTTAKKNLQSALGEFRRKIGLNKVLEAAE